MSNLLKLIPSLMSLNLVSENFKELKEKKPKLVKLGVKNIIGVNLIKEVAKL